jgi:hypothetical protein
MGGWAAADLLRVELLRLAVDLHLDQRLAVFAAHHLEVHGEGIASLNCHLMPRAGIPYKSRA